MSAPPSKGGILGWGNEVGGGGADFSMNLQTNRQTKDTTPARLAARDAAGQCVPLVTDQEPLAELRRLIIRFSQACPASAAHLACPFRIMGTLSPAALTTLVNSLPRAACLDLFKMEHDCRSQYAGACPPKNPWA